MAYLTRKPFWGTKVPPVGAGAGREVLLVTGLGYCGPEDYYVEDEAGKAGLRPALRAAGLRVSTCNASSHGTACHDPFAQVAAALRSGRFGCCIVLQVGSSEYTADLFTDPQVKRGLKTWVAGGGTLILHGERSVTTALGWFGKGWRYTNYTRTVHRCWAPSPQNAGGPHWCDWYQHCPTGITADISVKACMLSSVPAEECLFGTDENAATQSAVPSMAGTRLHAGLTAVAFGRYVNGFIGFFGDVNAESTTLAIVTALARGVDNASFWVPSAACFRDSPRKAQRAVIATLLTAVRFAILAGQQPNDDATLVTLPVLPIEIWLHILKMLTIDALAGPGR